MIYYLPGQWFGDITEHEQLQEQFLTVCNEVADMIGLCLEYGVSDIIRNRLSNEVG